MGQKPSQTADDATTDGGSASSLYGAYNFLLGCATPCADMGASESTGSLVKVVQHCCISSEREAALELVEQHRVIGDAGTMQIEDEDEIWAAWTSPRALDAAGHRQKLLVRPERDRRFEELYTLDKKVGEGSFGNVYKAHAKSAHGAQRAVAVKVFSLASPIASPQAKVDSEEAKRKLASFIGECAMLSRLDHPYVVRMHESFQSAGSLHLVLEMCQGGELYNLLVRKIKEEDGLEEVTGQIFFRQMLHAVGYLHAGRIVHRDVKPENFLVSGDTDRPEELVLKLCDFGTATVLTQQKPRSMVNIGTLSYTAPEVYMRKGADLPADIWSLGVVLYVMLTGTNPFRNGKETSKQETVKRIKSGVFATQRAGWLKVSEPGQDMVKKLLVLIEDKRLTCCEALQHGWVLGARRISLPPNEEEPEALAVKAIRVLRRMLKLQPPQRNAVFACAMGATEADLPQPAAWRALFLLLDADNDGRLSIDECAAGLRRLTGISRSEVTEEDLRTAVQAADLDGNSFLDWAEWLFVGLLTVAKLPEAGLVVEFAQRLLSRMCTSGQSEVVLGIWKAAQQLKTETDKEARKMPLSMDDLRLVLSSCEEAFQ